MTATIATPDQLEVALLQALQESRPDREQMVPVASAAGLLPAAPREGWKLELIDSSRAVLGEKYTFHLSSGNEIHVITVQVAYHDVIKVDGKLIVKRQTGGIRGKEFALNGLGSSLETNVAIKVSYPFFENKLKSLTIRVGEQVLKYPYEPHA
jgi:hypothetical protein